MDNQAYLAAMKTVAAADKDTTAQAVEAIKTAMAAHDAMKESLQTLVDQYAGIDTPAIGARALMTSLQSQAAMMDYTVQNMMTMAATALAAYDPVPALVMPTGPMPQGS